IDDFRIGALRDEILDHLVVAAGGGIVQRRVALVLSGIHVGVQFFDQVLDRGEHPAGGEPVMVGRKPFPVPLTGRREQRWNARSANGNGRQAGDVLHLALADVSRPWPAGALRRWDRRRAPPAASLPPRRRCTRRARTAWNRFRRPLTDRSRTVSTTLSSSA